MLIKNIKTFLYLILLLATFTSAAPVFAPPKLCEEISVDRRHVWCKKDYDKQRLKQDYNQLVQQGCTPTKAVGILGEFYAQKTIEAQTNYVSISTLFDAMGCKVNHKLRDGADRGIDDIFVVADKSGINRNFKPIFHESKFSGNCELKLSKTKTLCQQLSTQWLNYHVNGIRQRVGASICFSDKNKLTITPCAQCKSQFMEDMEWLFQMLNEQRFYRTASVLCPDGKLRVYKVVAKE